MKRLIAHCAPLLIIFFAGFLSPRATKAHEFSLLPEISPYVKTGMGAYRSAACPCFDRSTWNMELGMNLQFSRFIGFDLEYTYGSMLLGGNFPFTGRAVGLRSGLTPKPDCWWNDFYLRGGWSYISIMSTRDPGYHGVYLNPGWALRLFGPLRMEIELATNYYFGAMEHLNIGLRSGLKVTF